MPPPPSDYARVRFVVSFVALLSTPFQSGVNALCWRRTLCGNFAEIAALLPPGEGVVPLDAGLLRSLPGSPEAMTGVEALLADFERLRAAGLSPSLDAIHAYPRDSEPQPIPTDVYSFHADSAPFEADTFLCSYTDPSTEALRNEDALRRIDLPETRDQLLAQFGGEDDAAFSEFLQENCFDLHYAPRPGSRPFSFGLGNLWRIATDYPGSPVPPCIHRAPFQAPGSPPRLLLIS
ncbi:MAG: hypothetical protein RLZZ244_2611 [Verrucomicrobiota bacterium]